MAITFPTTLDSLTNPSGSDAMNGANLHSAQHANANDAIEALEAKVGVDSSAVTTSLDYLRPKRLFSHHADAGNVTTGETDLYSDTVAAGRLGVNDECLEVEYGGVFVSSATATRRVKIYFGGTVMLDTGALTLSLSSAWTVYVTIIRVSATVVRYAISFTTEGAALAAYTAVGEITGLTLSGTNVLKITGQAAGVGAATNDIVAKMGAVSWKAAA